MNYLLQDIASIQTGIYLKPSPFGDILYLQVKDFDQDGQFLDSLFPTIQLNNKLQKHLINEGDILVIAKGNRNTSFVVPNTTTLALASSTFLVVRLSDKHKRKILPAYLAWFINHPQNQLFLCNNSKGSGISSLSVGALGGLQIRIPTLEKQELILKIHGLGKLEQHILKQLAIVRQHYHQQFLLNSII